MTLSRLIALCSLLLPCAGFSLASDQDATGEFLDDSGFYWLGGGTAVECLGPEIEFAYMNSQGDAAAMASNNEPEGSLCIHARGSRVPFCLQGLNDAKKTFLRNFVLLNSDRPMRLSRRYCVRWHMGDLYPYRVSPGDFFIDGKPVSDVLRENGIFSGFEALGRGVADLWHTQPPDASSLVSAQWEGTDTRKHGVDWAAVPASTVKNSRMAGLLRMLDENCRARNGRLDLSRPIVPVDPKAPGCWIESDESENFNAYDAVFTTTYRCSLKIQGYCTPAARGGR
jgi:hypothetical protein